MPRYCTSSRPTLPIAAALALLAVATVAPPAESQSRPYSRPAPPSPIAVADVVLTPAADWRVERPRSMMRKAQLAIPGDAGDGELVVFFFGTGQGGGVDANVQRWLGQFQKADGEVVEGERETREIDGGKVTVVRAAGTYLSGMPMAAKTPKPGWALVGIIVESPRGPVFVKLTGPEATLKEAEKGIARLIESIAIGAPS